MPNLANLPITIKDIKKAQNTVKQYARETP
jgi:hypothetical protein